MSNLKDVIIKFKCKHCETTTQMSAEDLMEAGTEGPPYCMCTGECIEFEVTDVQMKG